MDDLRKSRFPELAPQAPVAAKSLRMPYLPWGELLIGFGLMLVCGLI
jgi:hypothetical protein